jgi:hypothetical protein
MRTVVMPFIHLEYFVLVFRYLAAQSVRPLTSLGILSVTAPDVGTDIRVDTADTTGGALAIIAGLV